MYVEGSLVCQRTSDKLYGDSAMLANMINISLNKTIR
jgi:hypothetical protein